MRDTDVGEIVSTTLPSFKKISHHASSTIYVFVVSLQIKLMKRSINGNASTMSWLEDNSLNLASACVIFGKFKYVFHAIFFL